MTHIMIICSGDVILAASFQPGILYSLCTITHCSMISYMNRVHAAARRAAQPDIIMIKEVPQLIARESRSTPLPGEGMMQHAPRYGPYEGTAAQVRHTFSPNSCSAPKVYILTLTPCLITLGSPWKGCD